MKNLIFAALIGTLTETEAIHLSNNKQTIRLQKVNILAQITGNGAAEGMAAELGIPGLEAPGAITASASGVSSGAVENATTAAIAGGEEPKTTAKPPVDASNEKSKAPEEAEKPSPAEPNSENPTADPAASIKEVVKKIKDDKDVSQKAEADDKKVEDDKVVKMPGQVAATKDYEDGKKEEAMKLNFPSVTDCAPYKVEIENGLLRLGGIRGKSVHQELLGRCQEKWAWESIKGNKWKAPEPNLANIAKDKAEVERLAEKSEWHQDNWNMNRNQEDD